jgi:hypothetical protein
VSKIKEGSKQPPVPPTMFYKSSRTQTVPSPPPVGVEDAVQTISSLIEEKVGVIYTTLADNLAEVSTAMLNRVLALEERAAKTDALHATWEKFQSPERLEKVEAAFLRTYALQRSLELPQTTNRNMNQVIEDAKKVLRFFGQSTEEIDSSADIFSAALSHSSGETASIAGYA